MVVCLSVFLLCHYAHDGKDKEENRPPPPFFYIHLLVYVVECGVMWCAVLC